MNRTWAENNQTIVRRLDGTYDTPYNPGDNISLNPGDIIRTPSNTSYINSDGVVENIPGKVDFVIDPENAPSIATTSILGVDTEIIVFDTDEDSQDTSLTINLRAPELQDSTNRNSGALGGSLGNGLGGLGGGLNQNIIFNNQDSVFGSTPQEKPYPIVLELFDVEILNSGINYSSEDKFVIDPENYGVVLKPVLGAFGSIVDVEVVSTGKGFTTYPNIYIESQTGYNAKFAPKFRVNRIGDITDLLELG
ncbi:MAG: hypothetical protein ACO3UU_12815, partial [Minisyncoccia bacterium]